MENRFDNPTPLLEFELTPDMLIAMTNALGACLVLSEEYGSEASKYICSNATKDPDQFVIELREFLSILLANINVQGYTAKIVLE